MTLRDVIRQLQDTTAFSSERERCVALHNFVRDEIAFGFTVGFEGVSPEQTLAARRGHCNAQADLFRALLEAVDIPARLRFVQIAKETLQAEKEVPPEEDEDRGKAALTELFNEIKTSETPIIAERVVTDIDEIVRLVRFPGWQGTQAGEREVKKALRKALFKYKLHADEELFEKAFGYVREYY